MRTLIIWLLLCCTANAEAMQLIVQGTTAEGNRYTGYGTCFVVGTTEAGGCLIVTAAHNFDNAERGSVIKGGQRYAVENLRIHPRHDVASFESPMPYGGEFALQQATQRVRVEALGFGPKYHGRPTTGWTGEMVGSQFMIGDGGLHSCSGDSGAPVVTDDGYAVGLVTGVETSGSTPTSRSQYAATNARTVVTDADAIRLHLTQYYSQQCGPNGCSIWLRPQIQQPQFLGIPTGPPRVVGVTPPIDSVGIVTRPSVPQQQAINPLAPQIVRPTDSQIQAAVSAWMQANISQLKGSDGQCLPITIILARDGREIDRETYAPGQPIILDVETLGGSR
jgi:hypothetical protein